jgi:hypothetical protein
MDALRRYTHDEGISVETVLEAYDKVGDGTLAYVPHPSSFPLYLAL